MSAVPVLTTGCGGTRVMGYGYMVRTLHAPRGTGPGHPIPGFKAFPGFSGIFMIFRDFHDFPGFREVQCGPVRSSVVQ